MLNWATVFRLSTLVTGASMLLIAPIFLDLENLTLFYVLYALGAVIGIFDYGLASKLFNSGFKKLSLNERKNITKSFSHRYLFLAILLPIIIFFSFSDSISIVQNTLLTLVLAISLGAHIYYNYLEGNVSPGLAYKSRASAEFIGILCCLLSALLSGSGYLSIMGLFCGRVILPVLHFIFYFGGLKEDSISIQSDLKFAYQIGITAVLGYFGGIGSNLVVNRMFEPIEVASYAQSYLIMVTIFSFSMSVFLYRQNEVKGIFVRLNSLPQLSQYKTKQVMHVSVIFTALCLAAFIILSTIGHYLDIVKFSILTYLCAFLVFAPLINNHICALIFRHNGTERYFGVSIFGFVGYSAVIISTYFHEDFVIFMSLLAINSLVINLIVSGKLFKIYVMETIYD